MREEEGGRKGEGERNKNPPSDRSGYGHELPNLCTGTPRICNFHFVGAFC